MGPSTMFLSKPAIAAVAGYAVAGGLELALLCDLRVVEQGVELAGPEGLAGPLSGLLLVNKEICSEVVGQGGDL